jgi:hypothetical protein
MQEADVMHVVSLADAVIEAVAALQLAHCRA